MKKLLQIIFSFLFMLIGGDTFAQQKNIAPDATVTCQTTAAGGCWNLNRINDLDYGTCGAQQAFVWSATPPASTDYIQWEWTAPKTVNRMTVYHAQTTGRFLAGCRLEYWSGSAWVNIGRFTLPQSNCENTLNFTPVTTNRLRLTDMRPGTGQQSNLNYREIDIFELPAPVNAGIQQMVRPSFGCETPSDIVVRLQNTGTNRLDSADIWYSINNGAAVRVKWNSGANYRLTDTLRSGAFADVTLETNRTFNDYTNYDFKIWSSMPNGQLDTVNGDDTLSKSIYFLGVPGNASVTNSERCGVGTVELRATTSDIRDDVFWYDQAVGGSIVATGRTAESPFLYETDSFYAEAVRVGERNYLTNGLSTGAATRVSTQSDEEGGFVTLNVGPSAISLDTLQFVVDFNNDVPYELYIMEGAWTTNPNDWTRIANGTGRVVATNNNRPYVMDVPLDGYILSPNKTYSLYFTVVPSTLSNNVILNTGTRVTSDEFLTFFGGTVCNGMFGSIGTYNTWTIDMGVKYSYTCNSPGRVGMEAEVKELLQEAEVIQGSNFDGYFRRGTTNEPDLTTEGRSITYELKPPVNNPNTSFGTSWLISSIDLRSVNGTPIPTGDLTTTNPTSTANGTMTYSPSAGWEDSTIMATVGVRNLANGCDTFITRYIYIAPIPTASFEVTRVCLGDVTEFTNNSSVLKGFMTYEWDFGDGNTSDFTDPVHLFQNAGTFQVKLTTTTELGFSDDTTITVDVNHIPNISYKVINACEGTNVRFDNQTTIIGGAPITYRWDFGDGNSSTMEDPEHRYSTPGGYRVTLRATANGCVSTLTKNANQFAKPVADFDFEGQCQGADIQFNNMTTISTTDFVGVKWTFEPGEFETINNPAYAFSTSGSKDVKMVAISQFNCLDSITKTVNVAPGPVADFDFGQVCNIDPTTFTNTTTEPTGLLYVYSWDFGDGTTSDQKSPTHQYTQLGERMVTLTVDASNNCASTISKMVDVKIQPEAGFDVAGACSGELVDFRNQTTSEGGIVNYNWNFGDGTSSTENQPKKVYTPMTSTSYNVELVASIVGGCSDTARTTITINETPICSYTQTSTGDNWGREWTFSPDNKSYGATAYTWLIEGQGVYQEMEPTVTFTEPANYRVKLLINTTDGCNCLDSLGSIDIRDAIANVNDISTSELLSVYPNPNNGQFTVSLKEGNGQLETLRITDLSGREVSAELEQINSSSWKVRMNELSSGVYLIQAQTENGWSTHKINVTK
jgi:PKD repeat protein